MCGRQLQTIMTSKQTVQRLTPKGLHGFVSPTWKSTWIYYYKRIK